MLRGNTLRYLANLPLALLKAFFIEIADAGAENGVALYCFHTVEPGIALAACGMLRRLLAIEMADVVRGHQQGVDQYALS